jgi:hypothetical protein
MIESYIRRNDVIRCELDLALIERLIHYLTFTDDCREDADRLLLSRKTLIDFHRLLSRDINKLSQVAVARRFAERVAIRFLERRETE